MCRGTAEGGRRCPHHASAEARNRHNERRRQNRTIRRQVAAWAGEHGEDDNTVGLLLAAPPSTAKQWGLAHQITDLPDSLFADQGNGDDQRPPTNAFMVPGLSDLGAAPDKTEALLENLRTAVEEIARSGKVEQWLSAMASNGLRRWSANNRILALVQLHSRAAAENRPELVAETHMMTAKQWKDGFGRWPAKGSKALWILRPRTRKLVETNEHGQDSEKVIVTGFSPCPVFNITQTDGPEIPQHPSTVPTGDVPPGLVDGLQGRVVAAGYSYREQIIDECNPEKGSGTLGFTSPAAREIVIDQRLSPMVKASTLAHELGHVYAGHVDAAPGEYGRHRGQMETEAEAAAYLTLARVGVPQSSVNAFSPGYIAGWMAQKGASFGEAMDRAVKASDQMLLDWWTDPVAPPVSPTSRRSTSKRTSKGRKK